MPPAVSAASFWIVPSSSNTSFRICGYPRVYPWGGANPHCTWVDHEGSTERICISVGTVDRSAVPGMNRHLPELEVLAEPNRNPAGVLPLVLPFRDVGPDDIASAETLLELLLRRVADREPVRARPTSVPLSMAARLDQQWPDSFDAEVLGCAGPDAGRVEPMPLGQALRRAIELRPPARPALDRQARRLEPTVQLPPRGVDRRGVRKWGLGLAPDPLEDLRLLLQEDLDGPVPFATVAGLAGQGEVAHAVGATPALGVDVLDLERHVRLAAIRARAVPLLEQVLPQLVAGERALLGRDARDLGVLDLLKVELDQLLRRRGDRTEPKEPADPGEHVGDAAFEARREPTLPSRPGIEPRGAVARLAGAAASTEGRTVGERRLDRRAPVLDLDRGDDPPCLLLDDGQAGRLRAGGGLDSMTAPGGDVAPIREDDREGESPEDRRPPLLEQDPRPRHPARGERLPVPIENKRVHCFSSFEGAPPLAGEKFASTMLARLFVFGRTNL